MHIRTLPRHGLPVERIKELVQSTDQSWHHVWLLVAALIIATV